MADHERFMNSLYHDIREFRAGSFCCDTCHIYLGFYETREVPASKLLEKCPEKTGKRNLNENPGKKFFPSGEQNFERGMND